MSIERAEEDTVTHDIENGIAWVKFGRPEKRNCMSPALNRRMMEVLDELEFSAAVGVLVLTGQGTAWSAGMDLKSRSISVRPRQRVSRPHATRNAKPMAGGN